MLVVVVTGLSGAGKSTAINALEDLGFFCVDNLPPPVVSSTLDACAAGGMERVGLGMDIRVRSFLDHVARVLDELPKHCGYEVQVVFLDASDEALLRRFSSTRRPHPLTSGGENGASAVLDGIQIERELLAPLRARATHVVDTTLLSVHDLRRAVLASFGPGAGPGLGLRVRFTSFGFKYGTPVDADVVLDVRFLSNPFFVDELRDLTGLDVGVREYVERQTDAREFTELAAQLLRFCLPRYAQEGKSYLTVAIGCTGGRHRSVVIAEALRERVESPELAIEVVHRDLNRAGASGWKGRRSDAGTGHGSG